jgi:NitT/TauT family transport system substrate-binding protein
MAVGSQTELAYLASTLAQQLGFYKREGLRVEMSDTSGGSKALAALLGGSADVVTGFYDHTIQMAAEGKNVKSFVLMAKYPGAVAVLSPEGAKKYHRIEDLRGATVGITAPGSSSHFFLNYLLQTHGVSPRDVNVLGLGANASRVAALERSTVDAGVLFEPGVTELTHRTRKAVVLADTRTPEGVRSLYGTSDFPSAVLYATGSWLHNHPDVARRLTRAILRTLTWIAEHSPEQIADRMPADFQGTDPTLYVEALRHSIPMFSSDGLMTVQGAEAVRKVLALSSDKVRHANVDLSQTYTNEFVVSTSGLQTR